MLKADFGGVPVEIWFTPSFNIKTTDKRIELMLRNQEIEVFDPWSKMVRKAKATKSLQDAYLVIEEYRILVPEAKIKITQAPEVPSSTQYGTTENPALD
ncbi:hypothetical protein CN367_11760 [Priestia megaterium]|uniref:hypothetical protein n=1 Tax=Priestia megaterium TaxID=1404 RepID=UPI000BF5D97A|nr:hypothetical protein [Priestia megaterium]PEZ47036.1 hypothetical protein CN367_11760 [Priestia megaterium]